MIITLKPCHQENLCNHCYWYYHNGCSDYRNDKFVTTSTGGPITEINIEYNTVEFMENKSDYNT